MMMMETSDQTEQRAGRGNGWTNGQRSQQSTNKGQRSTTTSIKQTTNTNTKRMQRQRQRQRQRRRSKDLLHLHGSIAEFSRYRPRTTHGVMVTHTGSAQPQPQPQTQTNTKRMQRQRQRQRQRRRSKDLLHLHGSIAEFSRYRPRRYGDAYRVTTATNANKHTNS